MILAALFVQQMRTSAFLLGFGFCIVACNAQHPVEAGIAYEQAIERASASDTDGALAALRVAVEVNDDACQHALLDTHFTGGVRDEPGFRDLIHNAAVQHTISRLTLVPEDEPGEWIVLVGEVVDPTGTPVAGAVVRLFATDAEGRYHPTLPGEDVPRIFGTVVTDSTGQFAIETVRPGPYPGTRNPRHIHVSVRSPDGEMRLAAPGYVVFDDDPLLFEPQNSEPRDEALRIAMETVEDGASGSVVLPLR